jgi:PRC-barrel domain
MTTPIDDVSDLAGKTVSDQEEKPIGEIKEIYALDGDGQPTWVSVETSGTDENRTVLIPIARLKEEDGELRVPYSRDHINETPEVDTSDGITPECERTLRDHFGIDRGDQELRSDNKSYATLIPAEEGTAKVADDPSSLEMPNANKRTEETKERVLDPGSSEIRHITAEDVVSEDNMDNREPGSGEDDKADESGESGDSEAGSGSSGDDRSEKAD